MERKREMGGENKKMCSNPNYEQCNTLATCGACAASRGVMFKVPCDAAYVSANYGNPCTVM